MNANTPDRPAPKDKSHRKSPRRADGYDFMSLYRLSDAELERRIMGMDDDEYAAFSSWHDARIRNTLLHYRSKLPPKALDRALAAERRASQPMKLRIEGEPSTRLAVSVMDYLSGTFRDWGSDFSVTGAERALIYSLVRWTGLRAKEARGMLVKDFLLDAPVPHVFVSAKLAKNKRENRVPLPAHLVPELKAYLAQKMPDAKALPVPERAAYLLRLDMQAGRTAFIAAGTTPEERERRARSTFLQVEIETEKFLPFDFHSLRGTASVLLQEQGIPVGFVQKILNHRTPIMTLNNYTNPQLETLAKAMAGETPPPVRIAAS
ncbi:hypothetical protein LBMAG48_10970 [Phycisphaerae bacterium]|nr:hypothetical protein LBMAG48_10970 [Phycisphaerae bacterium]